MSDWPAAFIAAPEELSSAPRFTRTVEIDPDVVTATLRVTAHGVVEPYWDGSRIGTDLLSPGWTSYEWRLRVVEHDLTDLIAPGSHELALLVGNGWYRGRLGWNNDGQLYGHRRSASAVLELTHADGRVETIGTDDEWQVSGTAVLADDLYDGETIDLTAEIPGPLPVEVVEADTSVLIEHPGPLVTAQDRIAPVQVTTSPSGRTLVDFGQNLVGWVSVRVQAPRGTTITLRHAEVLENGELGTRPLRSAKATDTFVCSGDVDLFEPTLTFHGFRHVEVTGWPEGHDLDLTAVVVSSDLRRIGDFSCSDPRIEQLHRNVVWGMRGNFLDVPTDCPQRDERLGWTGDLAVFAPTAARLFDVRSFLGDWLADLAAEVAATGGRVPFVVPDVLQKDHTEHGMVAKSGEKPPPAAFWSDAAVWVPQALWQAYGELDALRTAYPAAVAHVEYVEQLLAPDGTWSEGFQFGDWLDPDAPPEAADQAKADKGVVATAAIFRSAVLLAQFAVELGLSADADRWRALAERIRAGFASRYLTREPLRIHSDCTTVYALAIEFGLLDEADATEAGERLAVLVRASGHRISTGFAGTPYICDALTRTGHLSDAYALLTQTECPSWLYPVTMGATTIWERWDSMLPDGSINPGEMTSFNHYALGAVADWLHRTVAGLAPAAPGYARVLIAPQPGGGLTSAATSVLSPLGPVAVSWRLTGTDFSLEVDLPPEIEAEVRLPDGSSHTVVGGSHQFGTEIEEPTHA